ncbi:hypothetical protein V8C26DRAFT_369650 [Trichoderma gracile]
MHPILPFPPLPVGCKGGGLECLAWLRHPYPSWLARLSFGCQLKGCYCYISYSTIHRDRGIVHRVGQQCLDESPYIVALLPTWTATELASVDEQNIPSLVKISEREKQFNDCCLQLRFRCLCFPIEQTE